MHRTVLLVLDKLDGSLPDVVTRGITLGAKLGCRDEALLAEVVRHVGLFQESLTSDPIIHHLLRKERTPLLRRVNARGFT